MTFQAFDTAMKRIMENSSFSTDIYLNGSKICSGLFDYELKENGEITGNKPVLTISSDHKSYFEIKRIVTIDGFNYRVEEVREDRSVNQVEVTLSDMRCVR